MLYGDEESIAEHQQAVNRLALDISHIVDIQGKSLVFSRTPLLNGIVSMLLPEQFSEMDQTRARYKYPSESRPQFILTDSSGTVNFTFSYLTHENVSGNDIVQVQKDLRMVAKRMNPANLYEDVKVTKAESLTIPNYSARATAFDADLYIVQFVAAIHEHLLLGGFSCIYGQHQDWDIVLQQCLATIQEEPIALE